MQNESIEVTARAYNEKGRKMRAYVERGPAELIGSGVRCPHSWRDSWRSGDCIVMRGIVVHTGAAQGTGATRRVHFKAREVVQ